MPAHKHAALMMQYAQDAAETDRPWERWQVRNPMFVVWQDCDRDSVRFDPLLDYRRKPRTIRIGDMDVPAPETVAPGIGRQYYYPSFAHERLVGSLNWSGGDWEIWLLRSCLLHLTEEAAAQHASALIRVSGGTVEKSK